MLSRYQFDAATRTSAQFAWNEFCRLVPEMIGRGFAARIQDPGFRIQRARAAGAAGRAGYAVRLLVPFTPFICEELGGSA
ncbi:MAG: class I tRNA ligase family protein [Planctomycetaceae bacterium]